jgi:hypothetical protein
VSDDRLEECRSRLAHVSDEALEAQADTLEHVHLALVAELDDLLDGDRRHGHRG